MVMRVSICLPAYNEEKNISRTILEADKELSLISDDYEILVVNDGSTDSTEKIVKDICQGKKKVRLHNHVINRGYAHTTISCLQEARGDIIFIIDSDGQHAMSDIPLFLEKIKSGADVVVGWKKERNDPFIRVLLSRVYNLIFRMCFHSTLHDVDCGFRCFTKDVAKKITIRHLDVPVGPEIFAQAYANKWRVEEVEVIHYPRDFGESVFQPLKMPRVISRSLLGLLRLKREYS